MKIGVIGVGRRITDILQRLAANLPALQIVAWSDPDTASLDAARKKLGPIATHTIDCRSAEEVAGHADIEWIFIGSWNCFHAAQTILSFQARKNVFCEKPLALGLEEGAAMHRAWLESGKIFSLGLVLRYSPLYRLAKQFLETNCIGRLLSFEFNETLPFNHGGYIHGNWRRFSRNAGSHLLEKCCHDIDLALWLAASRPRRVASFGGLTFFTPENSWHTERIGPSPEGHTAYRSWHSDLDCDPFTGGQDIVDHQVGILEFESGVRATFHTHCQAAIPERRFYFIGTEGTMRLDAYTGRLELARVGWNEPVQVFQPTAGDGHAGSDESLAKELAECMQGNKKPAAGFLEGLSSLAVVQSMDEALHTRAVVELSKSWETVDGILQQKH
jgi:predicted dehydrogenase